MAEKPRILIVGAGPTGLTAAVELYRRGFTPRIIDKKDAPSPLSRAVGINARSLDLLEPSGITSALLKKGYKVHEVTLHEGSKTIGRIHMRRLPHRYNFLLALPQNETENVMNQALIKYGGAVEYGHKLTALTLSNDQAEATINDEPAQTYDIIIGADGIHSLVRKTADIAFEGYEYPARWSIADFRSQNWPGSADAFLLPGGHVRFIIRIGKNRYRAVADEPDALQGIPVNFTVDELLRSDDFVIEVRQAATYQKPPVYLAGDAAHVHSPVGGRGMNLGIEDAWDLARRINKDNLEGYTTARHPVGKEWIITSERLVRGVRTQNLWGRAMRNLVLKLMTTVPALQVPLLKRTTGIA